MTLIEVSCILSFYMFLLYNVYIWLIWLENWTCWFSNGHSTQWHSERIKADSEANCVKKEVESHWNIRRRNASLGEANTLFRQVRQLFIQCRGWDIYGKGSSCRRQHGVVTCWEGMLRQNVFWDTTGFILDRKKPSKLTARVGDWRMLNINQFCLFHLECNHLCHL